MKIFKNKLQKLFFLCTFVLSTIYSFSQSKSNVDITQVTKISFLSPGFSFENKLGKTQSFYMNTYLATTAYFSYSSNFGTSSGIYLDPALSLQYRYYYNAARRESKEKRTKMNSLNYISPAFDISFSRNAMTATAVCAAILDNRIYICRKFLRFIEFTKRLCDPIARHYEICNHYNDDGKLNLFHGEYYFDQRNFLISWNN